MAGRPIRWVWVAAGALALSLGLWAVLRGGPDPGASEVHDGEAVGSASPGRAPEAEAPAAWPGTDAAPRGDLHPPGASVDEPPPMEAQDPSERTASLFDDSAPPVLRETFERVTQGRPIDPRDAVKVYHHGQGHPRDPRAPLVLGYDAMNRGWTEFAFEHYLNAHRADPEIRWDPRLMADLLRTVQESPHHHDKAVAVMGEIYGSETRPSLERRMEQARRSGGESAAEPIRDLLEVLGR
jgi:hypothetical protein